MKTRVNVSPFQNLLQKKNIILCLVYGFSTLLVLLLQSAPNGFPTIFFARPTPMTVFVICVAVHCGARTGATIGTLAGLLWGVFSSRLFGFDALLLMLFGLAAGLLVEWFLRANFFTALLLGTCGVLLHVLLEWLLCYVIFGKENLTEILFRVLLPNGLYTVVLIPLVYCFSLLLARFVRRRINGAT